jgi:mRNA interferase HigB
MGTAIRLDGGRSGPQPSTMLVVGVEHIDAFVKKHPECRQELAELVRELEASRLTDPNAMKARYPSSKIIDGCTVVFKVRGNRYRLIMQVAYKTQIAAIKALETHAEYDRRRLR